MTKVSVIIPTYNCARYLPDAIESVLSQTYQDFEIIIVDDGSTDSTKEILQTYLNKYPGKIKYFYQRNEGPGSARNKGIEEAQGEYVSFLDSDDILMPDSLHKRQKILNEYPGVALVFSDYHAMLENNDTEYAIMKKMGFLDFINDVIHSRNNDSTILNEQFYYKYFEFSPLPIWTGTVMTKKKYILLAGLFRTDISIGEDTEYWCRLIKNRKVGFVSEPLTSYRHNLSYLTKQSEKVGLDCINLYTEIYTHSAEKSMRKILRKKIASSYYALSYFYKEANKNNKARKCLMQSIVYNPMDFKPYKSFLGTFAI